MRPVSIELIGDGFFCLGISSEPSFRQIERRMLLVRAFVDVHVFHTEHENVREHIRVIQTACQS